jgi:hypothetical protein
MKRHHLFSGALAALACSSLVSFASASSHREAPAVSKDPAADNTDVWAWVEKGTHAKLNVVLAYNPLEEPSGGPNFNEFSDDVLYELHITRGNKSLKDVVTYQIIFNSTGFPSQDPSDLKEGLIGGKEFFSQISGNVQTYQIIRIEKGVATTQVNDAPIAPINIGPRTQAVLAAGAKYDDAFSAKFIQNFETHNGRSFVGPRDDGFYVDLGGVFDLANLRAKGTAQDGVAGFNCHTIALEIPTETLTADGKAPKAGASDENTLGVWASASRRKVRVLRSHGVEENYGPWKQVSRLGLPLINEAVIGLQDKDKYNSTRPATDVENFAAYFLNPVIVRDAEAVGIYKALGVPQSTVDALKVNRTDIIDVINLAPTHSIPLTATGDVLRVDLGLDTGFPNGRSLEAGDNGGKANQETDVTDVLLSVLLSKGTIAVKDGVDYNDKNYLTSFPYLATPWEGFSQGHGKATP